MFVAFGDKKLAADYRGSELPVRVLQLHTQLIFFRPKSLFHYEHERRIIRWFNTASRGTYSSKGD